VRKIGVVTLGCPKNIVDSEILISQLLDEGYRVIKGLEELWEADLILINTCGFLRAAIEELLDTAETIAELLGDKPAIVMGCAVNRLREDPDGLIEGLKQTGLNVIGLVSTTEIFNLPSKIEEILKNYNRNRIYKALQITIPDYSHLRRKAFTSPYWAYLKIAEGCSHKCAFCTIPQIRGPYKSREMEDILEEARELSELGIKELIIISQDTTFWGTDIYGEPRISQLLEELSKLPFKWIRLMYLMPSGITDDLIDAMTSIPNVLPYFDIPFQHISPHVLKQMRRVPDPDLHYSLVEKIRDRKGVIRATFIVGHPGETDKDFEDLLEFLRWGKFERTGIFKYSPEPGTPSYELPQIAEDIKEERFKRLSQLAFQTLKTWMQKTIGETHEVLVEWRNDGSRSKYNLSGRAWFDAPEVDGKVLIKAPESKIGNIIKVRIKRYNTFQALFWGEYTLKK